MATIVIVGISAILMLQLLRIGQNILISSIESSSLTILLVIIRLCIIRVITCIMISLVGIIIEAVIHSKTARILIVINYLRVVYNQWGYLCDSAHIWLEIRAIFGYRNRVGCV